MKNVIKVLYAATFILLLGCIPVQPVFPLEGDGNVTTQNRVVAGFHSLEVSDGFDVILVQGDKESLSITADENLFEFIRTEVNDGTLKIYLDKKCYNAKELKARVEYKALDKLVVSGGGDVSTENSLKGNELEIVLLGGGDIVLPLNVQKLSSIISGGGDAQYTGRADAFTAILSGGGDLKSEIETHTIDCILSGGGDIVINSSGVGETAKAILSGGGDVNMDIHTGSIECTLSGGGEAKLSGKANELKIIVSGGGDVMAGGLATEQVNFEGGGGSDIHVNASKEINGKINGGGNVYYSGEASLVNINATGGSKVIKE